mmetsp:Transcript_39004/g.110190  ORF Transcript_39004/g.110190 Transcript_39004/m.110190 type:complete len:312 (-) Transcript_39004:393-1328(-)
MRCRVVACSEAGHLRAALDDTVPVDVADLVEVAVHVAYVDSAVGSYHGLGPGRRPAHGLHVLVAGLLGLVRPGLGELGVAGGRRPAPGRGLPLPAELAGLRVEGHDYAGEVDPVPETPPQAGRARAQALGEGVHAVHDAVLRRRAQVAQQVVVSAEPLVRDGGPGAGPQARHHGEGAAQAPDGGGLVSLELPHHPVPHGLAVAQPHGPHDARPARPEGLVHRVHHVVGPDDSVACAGNPRDVKPMEHGGPHEVPPVDGEPVEGALGIHEDYRAVTGCGSHEGRAWDVQLELPPQVAVPGAHCHDVHVLGVL